MVPEETLPRVLLTVQDFVVSGIGHEELGVDGPVQVRDEAGMALGEKHAG